MRIRRCDQRVSVGRVTSPSRTEEPITQLPGFRPGARPPATPKLISPPQPAAIACVRASREMLAVTAADHRNAEARRDASLEGHPHHNNHSHAPPGTYTPKDTTRLFPLFRLR